MPRKPDLLTLTAAEELALVLDPEHSKAVVDHRQAKRAKLTPYAAKLLAREFAKCANPNAAADEMIAMGWQGFKAEWLQKSGSARSNGTDALRAKLMEEINNGEIEGIGRAPHSDFQPHGFLPGKPH